jgi:hypothetical protein
MFAKKNLIAVLTIAMMIFAGSQASGYSDTEVIDYTWYEDDYPAGDFDLLGSAYKTIEGTWLAMTGLIGDVIGDQSDDFEDAPRMESPEPILTEPKSPEPKLDVQYQYEYVPRHTSGYPKWIRRPIK